MGLVGEMKKETRPPRGGGLRVLLDEPEPRAAGPPAPATAATPRTASRFAPAPTADRENQNEGAAPPPSAQGKLAPNPIERFRWDAASGRLRSPKALASPSARSLPGAAAPASPLAPRDLNASPAAPPPPELSASPALPAAAEPAAEIQSPPRAAPSASTGKSPFLHLQELSQYRRNADEALGKAFALARGRGRPTLDEPDALRARRAQAETAAQDASVLMASAGARKCLQPFVRPKAIKKCNETGPGKSPFTSFAYRGKRQR